MNEVRINREEEQLTVALYGDIHAGNAEEFYTEVIEEYAVEPKNVLIDCKELNFIDSTTLGTFVKILKRVKTDGYKMSLINLQSKIKKLFVICSLDTIMEIE